MFWMEEKKQKVKDDGFLKKFNETLHIIDKLLHQTSMKDETRM